MSSRKHSTLEKSAYRREFLITQWKQRYWGGGGRGGVETTGYWWWTIVDAAKAYNIKGGEIAGTIKCGAGIGKLESEGREEKKRGGDERQEKACAKKRAEHVQARARLSSSTRVGDALLLIRGGKSR